MTTKLALSLEMTDLQLYDRIWNLRDRPKPMTWEEIKEILKVDLESKTIAKWLERYGKKNKQPYKKRGSKKPKKK